MLKNLTAALIVAGVMTTAAFAQNVDVKSAINDLSNRSGSVRQNAVMILGSSNDRSVVSNIERLAYDSDSGVRTAVCWALGQFKSPTSENVLNSLARDSRPEVRQAAVNALGNYKSVATGETLIRATYDSDVNVRKSAFERLFSRYSEFKNTITNTFKGNIDVLVNSARLRGYDSSIQASLYSDNIDVSVYNNLIDTVNNNMDKIYKYFNNKKEYRQKM